MEKAVCLSIYLSLSLSLLVTVTPFFTSSSLFSIKEQNSALWLFLWVFLQHCVSVVFFASKWMWLFFVLFAYLFICLLLFYYRRTDSDFISSNWLFTRLYAGYGRGELSLVINLSNCFFISPLEPVVPRSILVAASWEFFGHRRVV